MTTATAATVANNTMSLDANANANNNNDDDMDVDVAIVGGGITGLYAAYMIAKEDHEHNNDNNKRSMMCTRTRRIAVFEATERLGGIVKTARIGGNGNGGGSTSTSTSHGKKGIDFDFDCNGTRQRNNDKQHNDDGFHAELGPMRFIVDEQPLFRQLIHELGIDTVPFIKYENKKVPYRSMNTNVNRNVNRNANTNMNTTRTGMHHAGICSGDTHTTTGTTGTCWPLYQVNRTDNHILHNDHNEVDNDHNNNSRNDTNHDNNDPFKLMMEILYEAFRPALIHSFPTKLIPLMRDGGKCMNMMNNNGGDTMDTASTARNIESCSMEYLQTIIENFTEDHYRWIREDAFVVLAEDNDPTTPNNHNNDDDDDNDDGKQDAKEDESRHTPTKRHTTTTTTTTSTKSKFHLREVSLPWLVHTNRRLQETMSFNYVEFLQNHAPFFHGYMQEGSAAEKFVNSFRFVQVCAPAPIPVPVQASVREQASDNVTTSTSTSLVTIEHGVESIIHALRDRLDEMGVKIYLNSRLAMMRPSNGNGNGNGDDGKNNSDDDNGMNINHSDHNDHHRHRHHRTNLFFHGTSRTISAQTTFLCIPAWDIKQLGDADRTFHNGKNVSTMLSNVNPVKLFKIFFVVKHPWWEDDASQKNQGLDRIPAREIHYYTYYTYTPSSSSSSCSHDDDDEEEEEEEKKKSHHHHHRRRQHRKGVILVYGDEPSYNTWSDLLENNIKHHDKRTKLFFECMRCELNHDISNIEESIAVAWRGEAGSTSTVAFLGTKMSCHDTLRQAQAIALKGSMVKNIAIANGCFSDYCGFIEGGLRMALSACLNHDLIQQQPPQHDT